MFTESLGSDEVREGFAAFVEKRPPRLGEMSVPARYPFNPLQDLRQVIARRICPEDLRTP